MVLHAFFIVFIGFPGLFCAGQKYLLDRGRDHGFTGIDDTGEEDIFDHRKSPKKAAAPKSLRQAILDEDIPATEAALNRGENINQQYDTPSKGKRLVKAVDVFLGGLPLQKRYGWAPLHQAVARNNIQLARLLLDRDASTEVLAGDGWTPLHTAAMYGHVDMINLLLDYRAAVDAHGYNNFTPLARAAWFRRYDAMRALIARGADVRLPHTEEFGQALLHLAAGWGGVDPGEINVADWGALETGWGDLVVVGILLENGADRDAVDKKRKTALDYARALKATTQVQMQRKAAIIQLLTTR